jgi:hypothetical protein
MIEKILSESLYNGMTVRDLAKVTGKTKKTILNYYHKLFENNITIKRHIIRFSRSEAKEIVRAMGIGIIACRKPLENNYLGYEKNFTDYEKNEIQILSPLTGPERLSLVNVLVKEHQKYVQNLETEWASFKNDVFKVAGIPTDEQEQLGYMLTQLGYEVIDRNSDDTLKKLSLIYRENNKEA